MDKLSALTIALWLLREVLAVAFRGRAGRVVAFAHDAAAFVARQVKELGIDVKDGKVLELLDNIVHRGGRALGLSDAQLDQAVHVARDTLGRALLENAFDELAAAAANFKMPDTSHIPKGT